MDQNTVDVVIVGAGAAGLSCARELRRRGRAAIIVEGNDSIGGRIRTDLVDGFRLDHGFQVLLTAYPEVRRELDVEALGLGTFTPGAVIRTGGAFHQVSDPLRVPSKALKTATAPIGTLADKLRLLSMVRDVKSGSVAKLIGRPDATSRARLKDRGFSNKIINQFFGPLYSGIFLERELETTSRRLEFIMRMQATGEIGLPSGGMAAIPTQLADSIPTQDIRTGTRVTVLGDDAVTLSDGSRIHASCIVLATDQASAESLLGDDSTGLARASARTTPSPACTTLYYATTTPPHTTPTLILNGDGSGPVDNAAVLTNVQPSYAPDGWSLIQATHIGVPDTDETAFEALVRTQLTEWFGAPVADWRHLATHRIKDALPFHGPGTDITPRAHRINGAMWVCGDHLGGGTLHGAMASGRAAGVAVAERLGA